MSNLIKGETCWTYVDDSKLTPPAFEFKVEELTLEIPYKDPVWTTPDEEEYPLSGCFGYIEGSLILGRNHHQEILALLRNRGWTWMQLGDAEQIWGWYTIENPKNAKPYVRLTYVSDAAYLHKSASKKCKQAFRDLLGIEDVRGKYKENCGDVESRNRGTYGGDYDKHYAKGNLRLEQVLENPSIVTPIPDPPEKDSDG